MRSIRIITAVALASFAAACVYRAGTTDTKLAQGAEWTATFVPTTVSAIRGTVTFIRTDPVNQTRVMFDLKDGMANTVMPWHVHYGVCGKDTEIVGAPANYPPLVVDGSGGLRAVALLPVELTTKSTYVIHLHASPTEMKTVVACAILIPQRPAPQVASGATR
jgi:hypothetical protein